MTKTPGFKSKSRLFLASSVVWSFSTNLNLFRFKREKINYTASVGVLLTNKNSRYFKLSQKDLLGDIRWLIQCPEGLKDQVPRYVSRSNFQSRGLLDPSRSCLLPSFLAAMVRKQLQPEKLIAPLSVMLSKKMAPPQLASEPNSGTGVTY